MDTQIPQANIILVSCGSFSPITYAHLRIFEMAKNFIHKHTTSKVVCGIISPVHDAYSKPGLAHSKHRLTMCSLATRESDWIVVDPWECYQKNWNPTRECLQHIYLNYIRTLKDNQQCINFDYPKSLSKSFTIDKKSLCTYNYRIMLLCGTDILSSFFKPGVWSKQDFDFFFRSNFGLLCIPRANFDEKKVFYPGSMLNQYKQHIVIVPYVVRNDISSTHVRMLVKEKHSIRYLIPFEVEKYIMKTGLYSETWEKPLINTNSVPEAVLAFTNNGSKLPKL